MEWVRVITDIHMDPNTAIRNAEVVEIKPTGNGLTYRGFHEETDSPEFETAEKTTVSGVIYTDLDEFNIYTFPKSLSRARQKLSQPPALPVNTQQDALPEGKTGNFRKDEQYAVYSGPSESYEKGAPTSVHRLIADQLS